MDLIALTQNLQIVLFILGVFTIVIAGVQDRKTRLAPAIYLSPTLIGFGLNPYLGLIGLVLTMISLFLWKDEWNESFGLADALLFLSVIMCTLNLNTVFFVIAITAGVMFELLLKKREGKQPLVWLYAKWICIIFVIFMLIAIGIGL